MSDENKDRETNSDADEVEWSGTPLQSWKGPGEDAGKEVREEEQQEIEFGEAQIAEIEDLGEPGEAPGPAEVEEVREQLAEAETPVEQEAEAPAEPAPELPALPAEPGGQPVDYSRTFRSLAEGDVVKGVVVHIDKEGVLVDVGTKSEGLIRPHEISRDANIAPEDVVQVGDKIDVYVLQSEDQDGSLILSKKRADFERAWRRVEEAHATGKILSAMVTDRVKGGLVVDLGIRGFVPGSHVGRGNVKNLERYVGQSLPLRVIEVDRERRKVVLSHKMAIEEERERQRGRTLSTLAEGQVRPGVVRRITDYGAFVDLGGIDGLLHVSEMSWTRIGHPSDVVKVGDKIHVMVLKLDLDHGKVSLGLRQILPDPWAEVERKYKVGDVITGSVTRLVPFGAFVQVDGGIEGIIPNSELAARRVSKPEDVVSVGQEVEVTIIDLRPEERRMTLSLRQLQQQRDRERERAEYTSYSYGRQEARTTIGDLVGDTIRQARTERRERRRREREADERAEVVGGIEEVVEEAVEPMFESEPEAVEPAAGGEPEASVEGVEEAAAAEVTAAEPEAVAETVEAPAEEEAAAEAQAPEVAEPVEAEAPEVAAEAAEPVEPAEPAGADETPAAQAEEAPAQEAKPKRTRRKLS